MIELVTERDEIARHVVERDRRIPCAERIARIKAEIRRTGCSRGAVDWRQKHEIPAGIVDSAATDRHAVAAIFEPHAVVEHETEEVLRRGGGIAARAPYASAKLAAGVDRHRERRLVHESARFVVILQF